MGSRPYSFSSWMQMLTTLLMNNSSPVSLISKQKGKGPFLEDACCNLLKMPDAIFCYWSNDLHMSKAQDFRLRSSSASCCRMLLAFLAGQGWKMRNLQHLQRIQAGMSKSLHFESKSLFLVSFSSKSLRWQSFPWQQGFQNFGRVDRCLVDHCADFIFLSKACHEAFIIIGSNHF